MEPDERRELVAVDDVLDSVIARIGAAAVTGLAAVRDAWPRVSGAGWEGTRPARLVRGVLTVEVPDGVTASRLRFDSGRLLAELTRELPDADVRSLALRVAGASTRGRR